MVSSTASCLKLLRFSLCSIIGAPCMREHVCSISIYPVLTHPKSLESEKGHILSFVTIMLIFNSEVPKFHKNYLTISKYICDHYVLVSCIQTCYVSQSVKGGNGFAPTHPHRAFPINAAFDSFIFQHFCHILPSILHKEQTLKYHRKLFSLSERRVPSPRRPLLEPPQAHTQKKTA